jgi:tight adherence protein C
MELLIIAGLVVLGVGGTVALVRFGLNATQTTGTDIQSRLEEYASRTNAPLTLEEIELSQPFSQRVVRPMLITLSKGFSKLSPSKSRAATELQLQLAGKPYNWGPSEFFGLRVFVALILGVLLFLLISISQGFAIALAAGLFGALLGFTVPIFWLRSKIRRRQHEIIKALPDALDLLTIIVEAGMGFDGAMQKVA